MKKSIKMPALLLAGNLLDYYDFFLFAHLGYVILPLFTSPIDPSESHLLSMLLLGIAFVVRPLGGYIFGRISDLIDRKTAVSQSILWIGIATVGLALLPTYEQIGVTAMCLLVLCRVLQGASVGGEFPSAGTYLVESFPNNRGLMSAFLSVSSEIGSIIAFGFAWFCLQENAPSWLWRVAFLLGGLASIMSYFLRKNLAYRTNEIDSLGPTNYQPQLAIMTTLLLGFVCSVFAWLPLTYSNFYITSVLNYPAQLGLNITLLGMVTALCVKPMIGKISDNFEKFNYLFMASFLTIPLVLIGFAMIVHANIYGQILLSIAGALFSAPVHAIMNSLFPKAHRSRSVNVFFMLGVSAGGFIPFLCAFVVSKTHFHFFPGVLCASIAFIAGILFLGCRQKST